ncbi:hypothetical protein IAU60_000526 [Kwoniella sp. DSM 27419]
MTSADPIVPFTDPRWTTLNSATHEATRSTDGLELSFPTEKGTDWWRIPGTDSRSGLVYGFEHEFGRDAGGFEVGVELGVQAEVQYDQAALFLKLDDADQTWIKTGIEFENDKEWAGVVVSNPMSDWSLLPPPPNPRFEISLQGQHLRVFLNGDMIRQVKAFGDGKATKAFIGVMGCSPKGGGAMVTFRNFTLKSGAREGD